MIDELIRQALDQTKLQSESDLRFELRYGTITASKIYNIALTKKTDGTFVNTQDIADSSNKAWTNSRRSCT